MGDFPFQHVIGRKADGVLIAFLLQQSVQRRPGEGGVTPKQLGDVQVTVACNHRQQHSPPELRAGLVASPQHGSFQIAILIEQKQWMIAGALEVPVVG
jgi:hypothetical protein